ARVRGARVLVVGAGAAALTAAWRLRQAGVDVRVADAQTRTGGRMLSLRGHFADGQVAELGGELVDTGHARIRALAAELGLALDDLRTGEPFEEVWHVGGARRTEAEVVAAWAPVAALVARDLRGLDVDAVGWRRPALGAALDRVSVAEWLETRGVGGWMRDLLRVAYTTEFGIEPDRQSSLNLLTLIDPAPDAFRVFGDSDERFHVRGGNDLIVRGLAERLGESTFTLGRRLVALSPGAGGGWRATFDGDGGPSTADATHVVLAVPFTLLREVRLDAPLPPAQRRAIAELGYGTNAKLMVGFGERVWRTRHAANGSVLTDRPFQLTWETSRGQDGRAGILTNFTGGARGVALGNGTPAERAADLARELDPILPGAAAARDGREARFHWPSHPWTRGSYASYLAGQWTAVRGAEGLASGTLHFAGEHTSREAQGFMEGGCESGERAAREVLSSLGVRAAVSPFLRRERALRTDRRRAVRDAVEALLA
ncbi:NAD(P)/FAD-dependent oxidoreductase, partial [Roseisolibacter sp. H3M3-2]|uniref:flavin monoamine oxidase family protein n=1 Tax=Roseisolibacter sp. H3M3-2 TaxID=3031323 RepID=UPI0023DAC4D1